jgi:NAD-dependent dihydropyrimidine dehydrogenase PreA subunit
MILEGNFMYEKVILCNCKGGAIDEKIKDLSAILVSGLKAEKIEISDLCGFCSSKPEFLANLLQADTKTLVLACHTRAVNLLLNFAGIKISDNISFLNLRENAEAALEQLKQLGSCIASFEDIKKFSDDRENQAWYPVLDYSRCTACGQCADFCLFGVYQKNEEKIEVINPDGCKINCPACARICPQTAIVFPKYMNGGAISGSDDFDELREQKRQAEDLEKILGNDIYLAIEKRKLKRKSIIKDEALKLAHQEREKALKEKLL